MFKPHTLLSIFLSAALASAAPALLAEPGHGKGNKHGAQQHQGSGSSSWQSGPEIDIGGVRVILDDSRDYWNPGTALPPGIQKNLARGKPLPPGIARKLDSRLLGRLPHYDGYEWQQAGTDLLLVAIATGVIQEVLHDVLN
ncbi:RcnB family protein [Pseudomonas sp. PDM16]|uniref:anti-virulence regulator CigR family protein n=1 Tax=Pseudomonas sp. PDM16 TaxID=2769292 RepID=UPI001780EF03|nr:anti-virulence regulator CigR family protein [Pseudomonas sp. PDM16]MBD9415308.1 RcnB family protein [Pseudomonas sp. PDM16]